MIKPKRIFLSPPHMEVFERQFIDEAFESNYIAPLSSQVDAFEKEFAEKNRISHAEALSSGTAAMHLALCQLGVETGDDLIVSDIDVYWQCQPGDVFRDQSGLY